MPKKYEKILEISSGGYGVVYECRLEGSDGADRLALKELIKVDEEILHRFKREVRNTLNLRHPRIVEIIDYDLESSPPWIVMPLYQRSLAQLFPVIVNDSRRILKIFSAILDGVEFAHKNQIIHRDLKPHNILLNSDDDLVISDFGLSKLMTERYSKNTASDAWVGTNGYMADEQLQDPSSVDHRADIYSLSCILKNLCCGVSIGSVQRLDELADDLYDVIDKATRSTPGKRFQTVEEFRASWYATLSVGELMEEELQLRLKQAREKERRGRAWLLDRFMGLCSLLNRSWDGEPFFRDGYSAEHVELVFTSQDVRYIFHVNMDEIMECSENGKVQTALVDRLTRKIKELPLPTLTLSVVSAEGENSAISQFNQWRTSRLSLISEGKGFTELIDGPTLAIHIYPLQCRPPGSGNLYPDERINKNVLKQNGYLLAPAERIDDFSMIAEQDKVLAVKKFANDDCFQSYVAFHNTGQLESVRVLWESEEKEIYIYQVESDIRESLPRFLQAIANVGLEPPIVVGVSLLRVSDYAIKIPQNLELSSMRFQEDFLKLPLLRIDDWEQSRDKVKLGALLYPVFSRIWQDAGVEFHGTIDSDGKERSLPF